MSENEARRQVEKLRAEIRRHDKLYYVDANPQITDEQYDALMRELAELEAAYPQLQSPDSPTQRVGGEPLDGFEHVAHPVPMLSVDNTYSEDELRAFDARVRKALEDAPFQYLVDPKIDGVAVTLRFQAGRLALAATRGDGRTGDDITANVRTLRSVPLALSGSGWPAVLEIRGEVYWPKPDFARTNQRRVAAGEEPFKNPRNATAGTLKQLDPRLVARRGLVFGAHGYGQVEPVPNDLDTQTGFFERLRGWGIPTSPHARRFEDIDAVLAFVHEWDARRSELDFETDGLVVKVDQLALRARLGATSKAPRWCIAYKYAAQQAQTRLLRVDFQVGKQGTITPRAVFEPVELAGTTVRHATLHNFDQVRRLDLHEHDAITVEKAGEIIPQVLAVDPKQRARSAQPVEPPAQCPECAGRVEQDEGGVYLRCVNPACPAQLVERLKFFCGRNQMDIDVAGGVLVEKLVALRLVGSYADLYRLADRHDELAQMPVSVNTKTDSPIRLGAKRAAKLLEGIERSKQRPLSRLLAALNIRHIGSTTAEILAKHFRDMDALASTSEEDLQSVDGVGPELAASLRAFFDSADGKGIVTELDAIGLTMKQPEQDAAGAHRALVGKTLVVTGTLAKYSRRQIEALIKQHGGKTAGSVSRKTHYLVAGENAGSKLAKAKKLGVQVLSEAEFDVLLCRE